MFPEAENKAINTELKKIHLSRSKEGPAVKRCPERVNLFKRPWRYSWEEEAISDCCPGLGGWAMPSWVVLVNKASPDTTLPLPLHPQLIQWRRTDRNPSRENKKMPNMSLFHFSYPQIEIKRICLSEFSSFY